MPKGLDYIINLKDGDFGGAKKAKTEMQGLDEAVQSTHDHAGGLGEVFGRVGGIIAGVFAAEKIIEFGNESREAFKKSEAAAAQVNQAITTTGGLAGKSLDELREKAEALEKQTLFGDEDTLAADSLLLTFTNIRGKIFDEAIPAIQDLAQRMAGDGPADLKGASIQVGKALNDPIAGINALRRVGVSFSDAQKAQIAVLVEHGQIQKAQGIILKELNTEFGGSAVAARKVLGPMGDLNQESEELKKTFGKLVTDGLNVVVPALVDVVHGVQDATKWIGENKELLIDVGIVVGTTAAAYGIYQLSVLAMEAPMAIMTAAQWALNVAMDANPVGIIITGIGALIGGLVLAYKHSETFRAVLSGIGEVASELVPIFKGVGETILGALTMNPVLIAKGFKDAYDGIAKVVQDGGISGAFNRGYDQSIAESKKEDEEKAKGTATDLVTKPGKGKNTPFSVSTGKHKGDSSDTSLAGGKSVRNVKVDIHKLIERLEFHTTNITGASTADLKRQLTELLVGVVHDSELALGSQ
ncbi:phage tail tape measure protein [Mucilaginibacter lappiensis]|uniref:Prophage tail length tape measure protein n=1 Tax=Mucilaginibacter lappiensis TaxID=354630 RepID=A0A841JJI8_9SPHI|nr:hypothetical protein [Mucilaginibacter lappiensis]MBB6131343.1 hypothetical protein [Mucilaginibacter lappiensis]